MKKLMKKVVSCMLALTMVLGIAACGSNTEQLSTGEGIVTEVKAETKSLTYQQFLARQEAFSLKLLKKCSEENKNTLISPLSISTAMAMAVLGADEDTLTQMLKVLMNGNVQNMTSQEYAAYIGKWYHNLTSVKKSKFHLANSIWIKNDSSMTVQDDFLKYNKSYLDAEVYTSDFTKQTVTDINNWVKKNTAGLIPKIIDEIKDSEKFYLINALSFEGEWQDPFEEYQVSDGKFTAADGTVQDVSMMTSNESRFIKVEGGTGFLKPYVKGYSFLAILPKKGTTVEQLLSTMKAKTLRKQVLHPQDAEVVIKMPKFKTEQTLTLNDIFEGMGMTDAFNSDKADFSKMGQIKGENLYISKVLHKTYLAVDEQGTKAGAVTAISVDSTCCLPTKQIKYVTLNRPFLYAIIDNHTGLPIFIGIQNTME